MTILMAISRLAGGMQIYAPVPLAPEMLEAVREANPLVVKSRAAQEVQRAKDASEPGDSRHGSVSSTARLGSHHSEMAAAEVRAG
jgi:hypothetical protein